VQPHAGVQVMIVGLAGHVGHGEVYRSTVGDGHCRGHGGNRERQLLCNHLQRRSPMSAVLSDSGLRLPLASHLEAHD